MDFIAVDRQITNRNPETKEALDLHAFLFINDGKARFSLIDGDESGLWGTGRDLSYGDVNLDGRLDLVVVDGSGGGQLVSNAMDRFSQSARERQWLPGVAGERAQQSLWNWYAGSC